MLTAACLPWYLNWNAFNDNVHLSPYFYFEYLNYYHYLLSLFTQGTTNQQGGQLIILTISQCLYYLL